MAALREQPLPGDGLASRGDRGRQQPTARLRPAGTVRSERLWRGRRAPSCGRLGRCAGPLALLRRGNAAFGAISTGARWGIPAARLDV